MPRKAKHPCHHPGCPKLTEEGSARNTRRKRTSVTKSTDETLQQGNDTDVCGNASVTAMLRHTPSVSCATRRECLSQ